MKSTSSNKILNCPICKEVLEKHSEIKSYKCKNNHSYDISKEGYVNLLISNQKRTKNPGDSKEMVLARMDFLNRGFYTPICNKINDIVDDYMKETKKNDLEILDIGCGEGYYLLKLKEHLDSKEVNANYYGTDISKDAIKYAAKSDKSVIFAVGNNYHIPAFDKSVDCMVSVFSPIDIEECNRALKDDGIFLRVLPRTNHLIELRNIIYSKVNLNNKVYEADKEENDYVREENVTFKIDLNNEELISLLKMTPHYWKSTAENKKKLTSIDSLSVTVDMRIGVFKKKIK